MNHNSASRFFSPTTNGDTTTPDPTALVVPSSYHAGLEIIGYDQMKATWNRNILSDIRAKMGQLKVTVMEDHRKVLQDIQGRSEQDQQGLEIVYSYFDGRIHFYNRSDAPEALVEVIRVVGLVVAGALALGLPVRGGLYCLPSPQANVFIIPRVKAKYSNVGPIAVNLGVQEWSGCHVAPELAKVLNPRDHLEQPFDVSGVSANLVKYPIPNARGHKAVCPKKASYAVDWVLPEISEASIEKSFCTFGQQLAFSGKTWNRIVQNTVDFHRYGCAKRQTRYTANDIS